MKILNFLTVIFLITNLTTSCGEIITTVEGKKKGIIKLKIDKKEYPLVRQKICDPDPLLNNKCKNLYMFQNNSLYFFKQKEQDYEDKVIHQLKKANLIHPECFCTFHKKTNQPFDKNSDVKHIHNKEYFYYYLIGYSYPLNDYIFYEQDDGDKEDWYLFSKLKKVAQISKKVFDIVLKMLGKEELCVDNKDKIKRFLEVMKYDTTEGRKLEECDSNFFKEKAYYVPEIDIQDIGINIEKDLKDLTPDEIIEKIIIRNPLSVVPLNSSLINKFIKKTKIFKLLNKKQNDFSIFHEFYVYHQFINFFKKLIKQFVFKKNINFYDCFKNISIFDEFKKCPLFLQQIILQEETKDIEERFDPQIFINLEIAYPYVNNEKVLMNIKKLLERFVEYSDIILEKKIKDIYGSVDKDGVKEVGEKEGGKEEDGEDERKI